MTASRICWPRWKAPLCLRQDSWTSPVCIWLLKPMICRFSKSDSSKPSWQTLTIMQPKSSNDASAFYGVDCLRDYEYLYYPHPD